LQDWIANRVKAKKAVILLDTCESGALAGGYTNSRRYAGLRGSDRPFARGGRASGTDRRRHG
jgi:hypothetical protein